MKVSKKGWEKYLDKNVYQWDLIFKSEDMVDDFTLVYRRVDGVSKSFCMDGDKSVEIPTDNSTYFIQIYNALNRYSNVDAFLKVRKICRKNSNYKLLIVEKIKILYE